MIEKMLMANQIFNEQKRFSIILNALKLKHVKKIQDVIRQQQLTSPYQTLREALIKRCKINENKRLNTLFNQTELRDKKTSELLEKMRQLLEAYDATNHQTNKVAKKTLF